MELIGTEIGPGRSCWGVPPQQTRGEDARATAGKMPALPAAVSPYFTNLSRFPPPREWHRAGIPRRTSADGPWPPRKRGAYPDALGRLRRLAPRSIGARRRRSEGSGRKPGAVGEDLGRRPKVCASPW